MKFSLSFIFELELMHLVTLEVAKLYDSIELFSQISSRLFASFQFDRMLGFVLFLKLGFWHSTPKCQHRGTV